MRKLVLIVLVFSFCIACSSKSKVNKVKEEYEKLNGKYLEVELENADIVKYSSVKEINNVVSKGTGVIFIGSSHDNISRRAIEVLLTAADNTDLDKIYYIEDFKGIDFVDDIDVFDVPIALFVLDGKIERDHVGTIDDKTDLDEEEYKDLYNKYLEGIHIVLGDACDESC